MPVSEVRFSDLVADERFEAEYYHPIRVKTLETLKKSNLEIALLKNIATLRRELIDPQNHYNEVFNYVELKNVPFGGFGAIFTKVSGKDLDSTKLRFKKTDILFSKIRTYLNKVVLIPEYIEDGICSTEFVVLKVNKNNFDPFALWIYLISKYTYNQVRFIGIGSTRPRARPEDILNIRVPLFPKDFQEKIRDLVRNAFSKLRLAEQKYQQAEELLYQLLGISKEEIERLEAEKAYETNFKEVIQAFRFDAEYYHPKFDISKLLREKEVKLRNLWDFITSIETGKNLENSEKYRGEGIRFIKNENLQDVYIVGKEYYLPPWIRISNNKLTKLGDIILSRVGSIGNCSIITEETVGAYYSDNVYRIKISREINPWFLVFYLRSYFGQLQFQKLAKGSNQPLISYGTLKHILVPAIPKDEQEQIAHLVREYFKLRKEARQLIQKAIREVEEEIENASRTNGE